MLLSLWGLMFQVLHPSNKYFIIRLCMKQGHVNLLRVIKRTKYFNQTRWKKRLKLAVNLHIYKYNLVQGLTLFKLKLILRWHEEIGEYLQGFKCCSIG